MAEIRDTIWLTFASLSETCPDVKAILAPERDLPVIDLTGGNHGAVHTQELFSGEKLQLALPRGADFGGHNAAKDREGGVGGKPGSTISPAGSLRSPAAQP